MSSTSSWASFDTVFAFNPQYTLPPSTIRAIDKSRRILGQLFFDRLLRVLRVEDAPYPPRTNTDLRTLHAAITAAPLPEHHRQALLFYILRHCGSDDSAEALASAFRDTVALPQGYVVCMLGFWHLDRGAYDRGVEYLTMPALIPTFADEILAVLLQDPKDAALAHGYALAVEPPLRDSELKRKYFGMLARTAVPEALFFARTQPAETRRGMVCALIAAVIGEGEDVPGAEMAGAERADRAKRALELVDLPLDQLEEEWFEEYLQGEGRGLKRAGDALMMRRISLGRVGEVRRDGTWGEILEGLAKGKGPRAGVVWAE
ncbi:hypothetical protein EJ06DRAFT_549394 [Trichodelitschia bisporula]|uniref:ELYS-like domain-containing protein n=1 Tax=Trichodelitschia bisporula TaxID=703511 RepID=A0A6G1HVW3_9PEZI|nr:hypothetical protein EJ06DRAFT_549394 [Trichodelitschia bisporula]